jgi:hypothetical protein
MTADRIAINALPNTYRTEGEADFVSLVLNAVDPTPDGKLSSQDKATVSARLKEFDTTPDGTLYAQEFQVSLEHKITDIQSRIDSLDDKVVALIGTYGSNPEKNIKLEPREQGKIITLMSSSALILKDQKLTDPEDISFVNIFTGQNVVLKEAALDSVEKAMDAITSASVTLAIEIRRPLLDLQDAVFEDVEDDRP